ncbi:MAG TPA: MBL fold metallo-hydrolase [Opitutaceae bacterium]
MVIERAPLEDELGDVLEKALRHADLSQAEVARQAGLELGRLRDAIDYRYDFTREELSRLAGVLGLRDEGLAALAGGRYPLPEISGLPFCLYPLRMPHGIGVANAYIVADCSSHQGILFDTGHDSEALRRAWPPGIRSLDAIFITHGETEHAGGLAGLQSDFGRVPVFGPAGAGISGATSPGEGTTLRFGSLEVSVRDTPGHAEAHHCYVVRSREARSGVPLLVSGDLLFAGSVGGGYYCHRRLDAHLHRLLAELPPGTVVAPGHGPLTTLANEQAFNPFVR